MSKTNRQCSEQQSLAATQTALMKRMDVVECNLTRVMQRVLNEVNAMRKENEEVVERLPQKLRDKHYSELLDIMEEDAYNSYSLPTEVEGNRNPQHRHMNSTLNDPLNEFAGGFM